MKITHIIFLGVAVLWASTGWADQVPSACQGLSCVDAWTDRFLKPIPLSDQIELKLGGEFRYRLELRNNFNLNATTYEDDAINLFRTRLNMGLKVGPFVDIFAQAQDSESKARSGVDESASFVDQFDLHQLNITARSPWKTLPIDVKVGRQELSYGDERFVGAFNWSNVARVFDALKIRWTPQEWFVLESFISQVVPVRRTEADTSDHSDHFYGLYATYKPVKDHVLDSFLFVRHNTNNEIAGEIAGDVGQLKEYTFGNRFKGKFKNFDYGIEWAAQAGTRAHESIQAWAWHNEIGYTLSKLPWSPRPNFEYNHASGDHDTSDGRYGTFDNLYPTNHFYYGYMDFFSLKNMNDLKVGCDFKPSKKLKLTADYHWFSLDTNKSNWFKADQTTMRATAPGASLNVGQEIDLLATYTFNAHWNGLIGYSHFQSGAFVKDTGPSDNADFFYTQIVWKI